jgi:hypothetical protein
MTYLQLVNAVLTRLREDTITAAEFDSDPYYRVIASHVNDAKDRVEDAWKWTALRFTDTIEVDDTGTGADASVVLPLSADNAYQLQRVLNRTTGQFLQWKNESQIRQLYSQLGPTPYAAEKLDSVRGTPSVFGWGRDTGPANEKTLVLYPIPDGPYQLAVDCVRHQAPLTDPTDVLKVPSLPVYTLATALASRERGEVGGTPISELFNIADGHLSDAIAIDSAWVADELDFYVATDWRQTNVRTA